MAITDNSDFQVMGPARLILVPSGEAVTDGEVLGYAEDDDLIRVNFQKRHRELRASDTGDEPAQFVFRGSTATITGTLTKWDTGELAILETMPGETLLTAVGARGAGTVGTTLLQSPVIPQEFGLAIDPVLGGSSAYPTRYLFGRVVHVEEAGFELIDWGNDSIKLAFSFLALRDANGNLYTTSTIT